MPGTSDRGLSSAFVLTVQSTSARLCLSIGLSMRSFKALSRGLDIVEPRVVLVRVNDPLASERVISTDLRKRSRTRSDART